MKPLDQSRALWNRSRLDLRSDEILAQICDRGHMDDWRQLYRLAAQDPILRSRLVQLVRKVPLPLPHFWLAAMASLGEEVDFAAEVPPYGRSAP